MHINTALLEQLYSSLNRRDARSMAGCYHPAATFHDIAFDLKGKEQISAMWRMICSGDISAVFTIVYVDDCEGIVDLQDDYTFTDTGRKVRNVVESRFRFRDGLIIEHRDSCDARAWAAAALGGLAEFLAVRVRFLRASKARKKLRAFLTDSDSTQNFTSNYT